MLKPHANHEIQKAILSLTRERAGGIIELAHDVQGIPSRTKGRVAGVLVDGGIMERMHTHLWVLRITQEGEAYLQALEEGTLFDTSRWGADTRYANWLWDVSGAGQLYLDGIAPHVITWAHRAGVLDAIKGKIERYPVGKMLLEQQIYAPATMAMASDNTVPLYMLVDESLKNMLENIADKHNVSMTNVIEIMVMKAQAQQE